MIISKDDIDFDKKPQPRDYVAYIEMFGPRGLPRLMVGRIDGIWNSDEFVIDGTTVSKNVVLYVLNDYAYFKIRNKLWLHMQRLIM